MTAEQDFIITVNDKVVYGADIEHFSFILNNPPVELSDSTDFTINNRRNNSGRTLRQVPVEYDVAMETGVFNKLDRRTRDILICRYEEPRMSVIKTAQEHGVSETSIGETEKRAIVAIRQLLSRLPFLGMDDFMIGVSES